LCTAFCNAITVSSPNDRVDAENFVSTEMNNLFMDPMLAYFKTGYAVSLTLEFDRNHVCKTPSAVSKPTNSKSAENSNARRDLLCYANNVLVCFGEEKAKECQEKESLKQIFENAGSFDSAYFFGPIPFVVCYSAVGTIVDIFILIRGT